MNCGFTTLEFLGRFLIDKKSDVLPHSFWGCPTYLVPLYYTKITLYHTKIFINNKILYTKSSI